MTSNLYFVEKCSYKMRFSVHGFSQKKLFRAKLSSSCILNKYKCCYFLVLKK